MTKAIFAKTACRHLEAGRYCQACGKEMVPTPVTFQFLREEILANWIRKGLVKTVLGLFLTPGRVVHRYLYDDREALIRPLTYLVVMLAFVASIDGAFPRGVPAGSASVSPALDWVLQHLLYLQLFQSMLIALMMRFVFFRHARATLPELTVMMMYLLAQSALIHGTVIFFAHGAPTWRSETLSLLLRLAYSVYGVGQFYAADGQPGDRHWGRALLAVLGSELVFLVVLLAGALLVDRMFTNGSFVG